MLLFWIFINLYFRVAYIAYYRCITIRKLKTTWSGLMVFPPHKFALLPFWHCWRQWVKNVPIWSCLHFYAVQVEFESVSLHVAIGWSDRSVDGRTDARSSSLVPWRRNCFLKTPTNKCMVFVIQLRYDCKCRLTALESTRLSTLNLFLNSAIDHFLFRLVRVLYLVLRNECLAGIRVYFFLADALLCGRLTVLQRSVCGKRTTRY
jgi:hypothetical protein